MKHIGKILIGVSVAAALIGGGVWYAKQRAAQNPEQRYKLATIEKGEVTQTVSANGTLNPVVLISVAGREGANIMTQSWHTMMEFEPPLVGCVVSGREHPGLVRRRHVLRQRQRFRQWAIRSLERPHR